MRELMWRGVVCTCDFGATLNPEHHYSDCEWRAQWVKDHVKEIVARDYISLGGMEELVRLHEETQDRPKTYELEIAEPKEEPLRDRGKHLKTWTF